MKKEDLFDAVTELDDRHIDHAAQHRFRQPFAWKRVGILAACGVLAVGLLQFIPMGGDSAASAPAASAPAAAAPSETENGFDVFSAPVLPLFVSGEGTEVLERARTLTFDYSETDSYTDLHISAAAARDSYVLMNPTNGDILAAVSYPSIGGLIDPLPAITVDGGETETTCSFSEIIDTFRTEADGQRWNFLQPRTVEPYAAIIEDHIAGEPTEVAVPALDEPVTVYTFTNATRNDVRAATLEYRYTCDPAETTVLSYGFNGFWGNENGVQAHDFIVNAHAAPDTRMLIVLGDDIKDGVLQGYQNGACRSGEELDKLTAHVTRTESTLGEALASVVQANIVRREAVGLDASVSLADYTAAVTSWYALHGPTGSDPVERYEEGRLDDLVDEVAGLSRVRWQTAEILIPAGESCTIEASFSYRGSYNHAGTDHSTDRYGYSLLTIADQTWPTTLCFAAADPIDASALITTIEGGLDSFKVVDGLSIKLSPTTGYHEFILYQ